MLDNFESISPTAIVTSYPRTFTDIPYEKEIYQWLQQNGKNNNVKLNKWLAPEIEARYKLTNKILDDLNIKQIVEIASGYSSRGILYAEKGEGLLRYLTFEEKEIVAKNIYHILKKHNGVWITCDVTPKKFIEKQDVCLPDFNNNVNQVTSRNDLQDRFEDIEHIKLFIMKIGFNYIEIHGFIEMKEQLKSFEILGVAKEKYDELLENGIVAIIKI